MKPPRIVNRGRIAPSSPKPIIDSGRNSWSTASIVSSVDIKSPEPNIAEQAGKKLQDNIVLSSLKKKIIIGTSIACILLIVIGILLGVLLSRVSTKPSPVQESPSLITYTSAASVIINATVSSRIIDTSITSEVTSASTTTTTVK